MLTVYPPGSKLPVIQPQDWTPQAPANAQAKTGSLYYSIEQAQRAFVWEGAYQPYSLTVPHPGTVRMELHQGDSNPWDVAQGHNVNRAELCSRDNVTKVGQRVHLSYLFELEPGAPLAASWIVCGQLRQDAPSASPAFGLYFNGGVESLVAQCNHDSGSAWAGGPIGKPFPIKRGQRYPIVIDATFHPDATADIDLMVGGTTLFKGTTASGYKAAKGFTWSNGIYRDAAAKEVMAVTYGGLGIVNP